MRDRGLREMMIVLFIVLFQKQISYTFGEGTYSKETVKASAKLLFGC